MRRGIRVVESEGSHTPQTGGEQSKMEKPRLLRGHKGTVTCCIASRARPGILVSSGEDGRICWFDLRCKDAPFTVDVGTEPITSLCFKAGNEDVLYGSLGTEIVGFDIHMASSMKRLESYNHNKEEINQIAFSPKSSFLAAADDSGETKIIDAHQKSLYKTLRSVHNNICSSVQFLSWRPWLAVTGGLDSKLVLWDFSKGRAQNIIDFATPNPGSHKTFSDPGQCFNPPFVHSIAISEAEIATGLEKIGAIARGDGVVEVIDIESDFVPSKSKSTSMPREGSQTRLKEKASSSSQDQPKSLQLDYRLGGHTAAVASVCFSLFGERGKFIISGGDDALIKVWDWSKHLRIEEKASKEHLVWTITLKEKVNWLCTTTMDSQNLVVCDTSKVMKIYTVL